MPTTHVSIITAQLTVLLSKTKHFFGIIKLEIHILLPWRLTEISLSTKNLIKMTTKHHKHKLKLELNVYFKILIMQ